MQLLQLIGILVIVNSLTCAGWFISHDKSLGAGGVTLLIVSVVTGLALTFHERAIEITVASPERKALLVTSLFNAKKPEEAKKLVDETIAKKGEEADKFKALLQEIGVLEK